MRKNESKKRLEWLWEFSKRVVVLCAAAYFIVIIYAMAIMAATGKMGGLGRLLFESSEILKTCVFGYFVKAGAENCNLHDVDLNVSIHFNSSRNDLTGDGRIGGTEVWMRTADGIKAKVGTKICRKMERIGFTNRGIKTTKNWYFLNHTKAPAVLCEVCFVDDKDNVKLYKQNKDSIASAILKSLE